MNRGKNKYKNKQVKYDYKEENNLIKDQSSEMLNDNSQISFEANLKITNPWIDDIDKE